MQVECDSTQALRQQVLEVNAGLPKIGLGFQGKFEIQALQQVREATEQLAVNLQSICRDYNGCVLDQRRYVEETRWIRERLSQHLQLARQQLQAPSALLGDRLWANARPDLARGRLSLEYRLEVATSSGHQNHQPGEVLSTGDEVRFVLTPSRDAFVYVLLLSSQGSPSLLFPLPEYGLNNPVAGQHAVIAPPPERVRLQLDAVTGVEHLQIIGSVVPLNDLAERLESLRTGVKGEAASGPTLLQQVGELICSEAAEAASAPGALIEASRSDVQCNGRRDRGLHFVEAPDAAQQRPGGVLLAAEPNDEVVIYQHEILHR